MEEVLMRTQGWMRAMALVSGVFVSFGGLTSTLSWAAQAELEIPSQARGSYKDIRAHLAALAAKYPDHARVISIGVSDSGLPIEALRVGEGPVKNLVVATHHGNEYGSTEVAKAFATSVAAEP